MRHEVKWWVISVVVAVTLGVALGLFAEEVLGIHYRWGLFAGIGIAWGVTSSRREKHRATRKNAPTEQRTAS